MPRHFLTSDFYKEAPGIVGGGVDKAEATAAQLDKIDAARAHQLRARIAEARKDYGTAEREFKQAIASAAHPADLLDYLGQFLSAQTTLARSRLRPSSNCVGRSRISRPGVPLYDAAGVLIESNRDPALAAKLLRDYLAGTQNRKKRPHLKRICGWRVSRNNSAMQPDAQREVAAALQLAHDYKPALEFKP